MSGSDECRLCLEAVLEGADPNGDGRLVHPCSCRSPVHVSCLARWREAQLRNERRPLEESIARAATCEICGTLWSADGVRVKPPVCLATCRAHGGLGKVALRRIPTSSRDNAVFSEFSAMEGQELEVLEIDTTGEYFHVRAADAQRYHGSTHVTVAQGWLRRCYLEWPGNAPDPSTAATRTMRRFFVAQTSSESTQVAGNGDDYEHSSGDDDDTSEDDMDVQLGS
mmetsp:Transcript_108251/g.170674  ORF Transcript_108251/g.170674 Transcript_108251/m.170674 type:complete len:225 (-) Transcript_108251:129-803(-)